MDKKKGDINVKRIVLLMVGLVMIVGLAACGGKKVDDATEEKYRKNAEEVVALLNDGNYTELHTKFDETMATGLPVDAMGELTPLIEQSGNYEKVDKFSIEEKDGNYITVLVAKYSAEKRIYTISFNEQEEVIGLYIK